MASNQLQSQLTRFISRGRNRRKPPAGYRPVKRGTVPPFRPYKGGVSPQIAAARGDFANRDARSDVANRDARYDVAQRKRSRKGY